MVMAMVVAAVVGYCCIVIVIMVVKVFVRVFFFSVLGVLKLSVVLV